jgi:hypothetical protein
MLRVLPTQQSKIYQSAMSNSFLGYYRKILAFAVRLKRDFAASLHLCRTAIIDRGLLLHANYA